MSRTSGYSFRLGRQQGCSLKKKKQTKHIAKKGKEKSTEGGECELHPLDLLKCESTIVKVVHSREIDSMLDLESILWWYSPVQ